MHIPISTRGIWPAGPQISSHQGCIDETTSCTPAVPSGLAWLWRSISSTTAVLHNSESYLKSRQTPASSVGSTNTIVGVVLGVVLGLFVLGVCVFLYTYRDSLRRIRRRHRRHRSTSSKSSKSSRSSRSSKGAAEAPPPQAAPPPPPPEGA
ncbi:hypothetical protein B0T11DRAFT_279014 [Plectosphaerella cucumerina]|uniref:Uncharacterized protein n=1 Tax=Plectosphaerella cucumerina TaxID=40658 RepID=A0A8K0TEU6_9PEZI|nr:hypothetical protein B0T11DRAFT_279014 [Plectosphaerella cucumerina]